MVSRVHIADLVRRGRSDMFVGRESELLAFDELVGSGDGARILYLHGPAGIGKTMLVHACLERARAAGIETRLVELHRIPTPPERLIKTVRQILGTTKQEESSLSTELDRLLLVVDTLESAGMSQSWLFDEILPSLSAGVRVLLAGRAQPDERWASDPGWRGLMRTINLGPLSRGEVAAYFERRRIDAEHVEPVYDSTHGHPLALSLMADLLEQDPDRDVRIKRSPEIVRALMSRIAAEAPTRLHRHALAVGSLARCVTQELLEAGLGVDDGSPLFDWLCQRSFARLDEGGVVLHELVQDVAWTDLKWRNKTVCWEILSRVLGFCIARLDATANEDEMLRPVNDFLLALTRTGDLLAGLYELDGAKRVNWVSAQAEHWGAIRRILKKHEGERAVSYLDLWRERGARTHVFVGANDTVLGFSMMLDLGAIDPRIAATDPGVGPIHQLLVGSSTASDTSPGGPWIHIRFWMTDEAYQGTCDAQTRIFLHILETIFMESGLRSMTSVHFAPEVWKPLGHAVAIEHFAECDYQDDGRPFGVFGVRFHESSVKDWMRRCVQSAVGVATRERDAPPLDRQGFDKAVKHALKQFDRPDLLHDAELLRSALVASRCDASATATQRARALVDVILECADEFCGSDREDILYRVLYRTYFNPSVKQIVAAEELNLSFGTYRRHLTLAVHRLTELLWDWEQQVRQS